MIIKDLKINNFGKLENKEFEFAKGINLIYGENESGKSTLLKFIYGMFYGLSKNKNGKVIPDIDKYKPWNNGEYSGKLKYSLDNGNTYEIFRAFEKKNPKIFNENSDDISKTFTIDKAKGNQFFYDQAKVDEELFAETVLSEQREVELDDKRQNMLLQKMTNIVGTGEDNTSYKKTITKLNKKLMEEVGTDRSSDRPINILEKRINEIKKEKEYLEMYSDAKYNLEENNNIIGEEIKKSERKLEIIKKVKAIKQNEDIEKEKIRVNKTIEEENQKEINQMNAKLEDLELEYTRINKEKEDKLIFKKGKNIGLFIVLALGIIIEVLSIIFVKDIAISIAIAVVFVGIIAFIIMKGKNLKKIIEEEYKEKLAQNIQKQNEIKVQIDLIEKNNLEYINNTKGLEEKINNEYTNKLAEIKTSLKAENISYDNILDEYEKEQTKLNNLNLDLHKLELEKQNILPKLDNLAALTEELGNLEEKYEEVSKLGKSINLAKKYLDIAYGKMKSSITPKFTKNLSQNIEKISNGKYKNVKFNDEKGIIIEVENGNYILAENLSVGTIEQLYLSLRLGAVDEISDEKLPLILDESFAYYDKERLSNILKYLNEISSERQILIFTCTNREKDVLEGLGCKYNYIQII